MKRRVLFRALAAALTLCLLLCLCACSRQQQNVPPLPLREKTPPSRAQSMGSQTFEGQLYFLSAGGNALYPVKRSIPCNPGESRAQALVQALCAGPADNSGCFAVIPDTLTLDAVALSGNVCLIYFSGVTTIQELLIARAALAATVTQLDHISYIDVYINDTQPGYNDRPLGAMAPITEDLDSYIVSLQQEYEFLDVATDATLYENRNAVLYYTDETGKLLLCEARKMIYTRTTDMPTIVTNLMEEWVQGPSANTDYRSLLPEDMTLTTAPLVTGLDRRTYADAEEAVLAGILPDDNVDEEAEETDSLDAPAANVPGTSSNPLLQAGLDQIVEVRFSDAQLGDDELRLLCAGIVHTITGFCPNMYGVRIVVGNTMLTPANLLDPQISRDYFIRADFADLLGESVYLDCPDAASGSLRTVTRCVPQNSAYSPAVRLQQLLDTGLLTPFTGADVQEVYVVGDTAVVNWKAGFTERLQTCLAQERSASDAESRERSLLFAIVNTLTELDGVEQVWLLQDGQCIADSPSMIWLGNPLLRNPGLIME